MSTTTVAVNAVTAAGSPLLHFAFVPLSVDINQAIIDNTTGAVIPANTTVLSIDRVARTVTMSSNAVGAGVGAADSLTFTASDTLDNQTLYKTLIDPGFTYRVDGRFLAAAIAIMAGTPTAVQAGFCGALFAGRVSLQILTKAILADTTNRTNCLLDVTIPGGKMTDAGIDTQVTSVFPLIANSRQWANF